jgi:uncharacterized protein (DUF2141 family)
MMNSETISQNQQESAQQRRSEGGFPRARRASSFWLAAALLALPISAAAASLKVNMEGIEKTAGTLMIRVANSEETFAEGRPVAAVQMAATQKTHSFTLEGLPEGTYALRLMHDVNDNGELDTNVVGMPKEPYAFSNNAKANFGPPKFEQAAFGVGPGLTEITITFE